MRILFLLTVLLTGHFAYAQQPRTIRDSAAYYADAMGKMKEDVAQTEAYKALQANYRRTAAASDDYVSFNVMTEVFHTKLTRFNAGLAQDGWPGFRETSWRIGFGQTYKRRRFVFDFGWGLGGFAEEQKRGNERIIYSNGSVLVMDFGYDLVKSPVVNLYPYGGFRLHLAGLSYRRDNGVNGNAPSISSFFNTGTNEVNMRSVRFGLQAGLGADIRLFQYREGQKGGFLFIKGGVQPVIGNEKFKSEAFTFNTDNRPGLWAVQMGIKLYRRG